MSQRGLGLSPPAEAALLQGVSGLRLALLLGIVLGAALIEEWVFRGVLLTRLGMLPQWGTVLTTAALFAAYHGSVFQLVPAFLIGAALAGIVFAFGSLWPAVIAHGVFNLIGLLLTTFATRVGQAG